MTKIINYLLHIYRYRSWNKCSTWYVIIQWLLETCSHIKCAYNIATINYIRYKKSGRVKQHGTILQAHQTVMRQSHNLVNFIFNTEKLSLVFEYEVKHDL
jgi:hypothetical protein